MKKLLMLMAFAAISAVALAIPAKRGVQKTLTLTDGKTVTATLAGDEAFHYYVTTDGTPLVETADGRWQAVSKELVKQTSKELGERRNAHRLERLAKTNKMFTSARKAARRAETAVVKKKGLVILVNFADKAFKSTSKHEYFVQMMNDENNPYGQNYGSVHEYFRDQSYGQFDLEFDVIGPVTMSNNMYYYGANDSQGNDKHPHVMVSEACKLADSQVNFADYDWDGDGEVDQVYVIYAGYAESSGAASNTIWPHEYNLTEGYYFDSAFSEYYKKDNNIYSLVLDGVTIDTYACGSELYGASGSKIDGIGTMCHEFSHCLGLPDFYDTEYNGNLGMDAWDLMDAGSYNGDGFQPAGYTAYERWFSGWLEPVQLTNPLTVKDMPAIQDSPVAYVLMKSGNVDVNSTYYLMYNHQQKGWDGASYGHGMLVQYVRYDTQAWKENTVNNSTQRMTLIPADGGFKYDAGSQDNPYYSTSGIAGDPWPGTSNKTTFSWNNHTISEITEKNELISFLFDGGDKDIDEQDTNDSLSATKYTLTYKVDGIIYKTVEVTYGTSIIPETEPTRNGYTFSGWSEIPETMPAQDVVVTGFFSINKHNLTYRVDNEIYKIIEVEYGENITPEADPTKHGYSFSGWSEIPETMPDRDVEVNGSFTINKYMVTWMINDEVYKTEEVFFGSTISAPPVPNRDGYSFSWEFYPETMPAGNLSIKGLYIQMAIDVKLNKEEITLKEGRKEQLEATVISEYSGYKDVIWSTSNDRVISVDATGNVTALNAGEAWVIAVSKDFANAKDSCLVIVTSHIYEMKVEVVAKNNTSDVYEKIGADDADDIIKLAIKGTINGYDVFAMRNKLPNLELLDLSEAQIITSSYKYYENYKTKDDILTAYFVPEGIRRIILPKSLKGIDGKAFCNCSSLTDITLPEGITSIGDNTFEGCSSLKDVKIPASVVSIGEYAFKGCEALTEIHLPSYLETIGDYAFEGCTALKDVYALMFDIIPIGQHTFNDYRNQTLHVPDFLFDKYDWDARWGQFRYKKAMTLNSGDYERFTTNTDTQMGEDDQRIPHKEDGEAIDATIQREGSFTVEGDEPQDFATVELVNDGEGRSGSLIGDDNGEEQGNVVVDDLVYRVSVEAETEFQYTPPVDLNIDEDFEYPEGQYKWWYFDGSDRAKFGSSGRKALDGKILHAHQGYVFMAQRAGTLVIHLGNTAVGGDRTTDLQDYEAEEAKNQGWNFMGNPYASYYDMSECTNTSPVTVWNAAQLIYEALRPGDDDFYLQPYQAFYVQKQDEVKGLKFDAVSRKSYRKSVEEKEERRALRRAKGVNPERRFIDLYIEASGQQADHTRLVANASAKAEYEIGVDAAKFMSEKAAAQIYTLEFGVEMAINERPLSGSLPLGYTAAKAGRMTIGASRMDAPLVLVDRQTGVTCDLSENAYEFTTTEGTFNNRFLIRAQGDDGIGALTEKTGVLIAIREGGLAVGGAEGKEIQVYSIDGKAVASQSDNGFISLKPNIYIVGVDGITAKIRIRK